MKKEYYTMKTVPLATYKIYEEMKELLNRHPIQTHNQLKWLSEQIAAQHCLEDMPL